MSKKYTLIIIKRQTLYPYVLRLKSEHRFKIFAQIKAFFDGKLNGHKTTING